MNNILIEIKGKLTRIQGSITGKKYAKITKSVFKDIIKGNIVNLGGLKGKEVFEIEPVTVTVYVPADKLFTTLVF